MADIEELKLLQHDYYVIGHEPQEDAYKQALVDCADELIAIYEAKTTPVIDLEGCEWRLIWDEKQQSPVLQWKTLKQDDWRGIVWLDYNDHSVAYISGHSVRFSDKSLTALEHGPARIKRPPHT